MYSDIHIEYMYAFYFFKYMYFLYIIHKIINRILFQILLQITPKIGFTENDIFMFIFNL